MVDGKSTMSRHLSVLVVILFFLFLSLSATFVYASRMKYYFAWFNKEKRNWRLLPRKQFVLIHTLRKIRSNTLYAIPYDILWKLNKKKEKKKKQNASLVFKCIYLRHVPSILYSNDQDRRHVTDHARSKDILYWQLLPTRSDSRIYENSSRGCPESRKRGGRWMKRDCTITSSNCCEKFVAYSSIQERSRFW